MDLLQEALMLCLSQPVVCCSEDECLCNLNFSQTNLPNKEEDDDSMVFPL
jgi:hypothetical protein